MDSLRFFAVFIPTQTPQTDGHQTPEGAVFQTLPEAISFVKKYKDFNARFKGFNNLQPAVQYAKSGKEAVQSCSFTSQPCGRLDSPDQRSAIDRRTKDDVIMSSADVTCLTWSIDARDDVAESLLAGDDGDSAASAFPDVAKYSSAMHSDRDDVLHNEDQLLGAPAETDAFALKCRPKNDDARQSSPVVGVCDEKPLAFPAPSRAELAKLRKAIEQMDDDAVQQAVLKNPRFLVNCNSDYPTILFEGCRYNALHVAAKSGNLYACELILRLFGSEDCAYVRTIYPDDSPPMSDCRRRFLLDKFVNTPDKALNETPLHFAAKNGHLDIVRLLYSLPICKRQAKNKYEETAAMLAKNRRQRGARKETSTVPTVDATSSTPSFCLDDDELVATSTYVALYRMDDFSAPPVVQQPCRGFPPSLLNHDKVSDKTRLKRLECDKEISHLVAYAGPMNAVTAQRLFSEWSSKKPPESNAKHDTRLYVPCHGQNVCYWKSPAYEAKRSDLHKGAERLGREVARRHNSAWRELWPFLNKFCDLASFDGLTAFENFFQQKFNPSTSPDAESLAEKLLALPSPFFDDLPRTPKKRIKTKLNFERDVEETDECFYDTLDGIEESSSNYPKDCGIELSQECDVYGTPPETPPTFFIGGSKATKADLEALVAIENCEIDGHKFPFVKRWKDKMRELQ